MKYTLLLSHNTFTPYDSYLLVSLLKLFIYHNSYYYTRNEDDSNNTDAYANCNGWNTLKSKFIHYQRLASLSSPSSLFCSGSPPSFCNPTGMRLLVKFLQQPTFSFTDSVISRPSILVEEFWIQAKFRWPIRNPVEVLETSENGHAKLFGFESTGLHTVKSWKP